MGAPLRGAEARREPRRKVVGITTTKILTQHATRCPQAHLEAHHESAGGALLAVEQARPLEPHVHIVDVQVLPVGLLAEKMLQESRQREEFLEQVTGDTSAMRSLAARRNVTEKLEAKETHQAARRRAHLAGANELGELVHLGPHEAAVLLQFELLRLVRLLVQRPCLPHRGLPNSEGC